MTPNQLVNTHRTTRFIISIHIRIKITTQTNAVTFTQFQSQTGAQV